MLLAFDRYILDQANRELRRGAEVIRIDPQQLDLLALFVQRAGELLSRQQIIESVWEGRAISDSGLSVAIAKLRKALGKPQEGREFIESRYGRGYRFLLEVTRLPGSDRPVGTRDVVTEAPPSSPLVGRAEVFEQLKSSVEQALTGRGRFCLLAGEPGIGKTRLAECVASYADERGVGPVLWGRCEAEGAPALWPVRQIVRELARLGLVDAEVLLASDPQRAEAVASSEDEASTLFGALRYGGSLDHGALEEIARCLIDASRRRPLVLIFDDIQWADSASLRVLTYIADELMRAPIALVCTFRYAHAVGPEERKIARLWNHRNCQRVELRRLSVADVTEYVRARLGSDDQTAELGRTLYTRSEGNPFFMVDLMASLGVQQVDDIKRRQAFRLSTLALDAVRERIEGLSENTRYLLCAAATIGHDFDIGLLSHMTGSKPEDILDVLDGVRSYHTVLPVAGTVGAFVFVHELIREVLYDELAPQERGRLHLLAGQGLQRRLASGGEVTNAQLAHHFLSAQPHGDVEAAIAYAQSAAWEASRLAAHEEARDLLLRALDVLKFRLATTPELRAQLLLQLSVVERVLGDPAYNAHLASAVAISREHGLGRLLTGAGQLLSLSPDLVAHAEAGSVLSAALAHLAPDDSEHLAIVHAHMAWTPPNSYSARRVSELIERAQTYLEKTSSVIAHAAVDEALLHFSAGPSSLEQAEQIAQRIERACAQHPDVASQARRILVERFRLITAMQRGDRAAMERAIDARGALLARFKNAELSWHHERMLLIKAMNEGRFAEAKAELVALRERARRLELHASELLWSLDYGVLLCRTSDVSTLASRTRPFLRVSAHDSPQIRASKIRSMVEWGLMDMVDEAIGQLSTAAIEDLPQDRDYLAMLCHLAAGAAAVQRREHCQVLLRLLTPYRAFYAVGISFHCEGSVATHLGLLCEALGDLTQAREHFAYGMERERAFALMPRAALTGLRLAKRMLDSADTAAGLRILALVQAEAESMGMVPLASAARQLLESRTTGGPA